jgi:hypothetical protein
LNTVCAKSHVLGITNIIIENNYTGFSSFYGWVAWHFEPFQVCADKTRRAFEIALSSGHVDIAFDCSFHVVRYAIFSGENLRSLLKEIDYYLHLLVTYNSEVARNYLLTFRETVSLLIDNGQATRIGAKACYGDINDPGNKMRESYFFHKAIQCYWLGHTERCQYYSEKCMPILGPLGQLNTCLNFIMVRKQMLLLRRARKHISPPILVSSHLSRHFSGLNSLDIITRKNSRKSREGVRLALTAMKSAADNSDWNFTNKLRLLEAEQQSLTKHHCRAIPLYDASIASAKRTGFIHEQGLACEKAGFYCKREENNEKAVEYFNQARVCYEEWGSSMKVEFIQKELDDL